ncbi:MAG: copper chaperone PCu(A)C [Leptothrix sp. (in: b-proteobacteria)]
MNRETTRAATRHPTRRRALQSALALGGALLLPRARACQFDASTLRITHPWTRESAPGATTARVCMKFDAVLVTDRLIGVETPIAARAEMGGDQAGSAVNFLIPAGEDTEMAERGTHIRLIGLTEPLINGREFPLRLTFEHGGVVNAKLTVDYARFG